MPFKTGYWGQQAKERGKRRLAYFRAYHQKNGPPPKMFRLGEFGELLAKRKLNGSKLVNESSHDLEWNGQKIEVKTSLSPDKNESYRFDIQVQKRENKTNYFFILILDKRRELRHAYLIPNQEIPAKITLSITPGRSKYDRYRLNYERNQNTRLGCV